MSKKRKRSPVALARRKGDGPSATRPNVDGWRNRPWRGGRKKRTRRTLRGATSAPPFSASTASEVREANPDARAARAFEKPIRIGLDDG
ncbi:hypothetical protein C2L80_05025 [Rubneribacter badeniensis]|uniref:Uncharacterized protein n=1 Tax=Rubneribacter badeniensis TaxID=2070688 RepID=A0A2K2U609_9ACTN|nr:hypothetical protein C2L80_05025 [Rubneribacter badeniensis]